MTWIPRIKGTVLILKFLDISRAHPHCDMQRKNIYVEPPPEMQLPSDQVLLLLKCKEGTRDANQTFEFLVRDSFAKFGFEQGSYSPCVYRHTTKQLVYVVHGDDYIGLGVREDLQWFHDQLQTILIVKCRGFLGPGPKDCKSIRILNRVVTYHPATVSNTEHITWEADQRHADLICSQLGINPSSKPRATPMDKEAYTKKHPLTGDELTPRDAALYKSVCMRFLYLVQDRPECQFASKELTRAMSKPTICAMEALKHSARFLLGAPRVVWRFPRQPMCTCVKGLCDSNWAGCPITRKSTSCAHLMIGKHPLTAATSTQTILSMSSGESEFYGAVRAACRLLGLQSLMKDIGWIVDAKLCTDSSAAKGMASRRGAGTVRHIHCPALWLQQAIRRRRLTIEKTAGATLSADIGTKASIPAPKLWELLNRFGVFRETSTSAARLKVSTKNAEQ